jgi:hypothetical protein
VSRFNSVDGVRLTGTNAAAADVITMATVILSAFYIIRKPRR